MLRELEQYCDRCNSADLVAEMLIGNDGAVICQDCVSGEDDQLQQITVEDILDAM